MTSTVLRSASVILRASHIMLVRVDSSRATPWVTNSTQWSHRSLDMVLTFEEVLKGDLKEPPGSKGTVRVTQYGNPSLINLPVPGAWSGVDADPGLELIVFSDASTLGTPPERNTLLLEPACLRVVPAKNSLAGVRLALRHEARELSLSELLVEGNQSASLLDHIFAEYLSTQLSDPSFSDKKVFEQLMDLLENPRLAIETLGELLMDVLDNVSRSQTFSDYHVNRLVIALFHIAFETKVPQMRENLFSIDLPNLLGLKGGATRRSVEEVFREFPGTREKFLHSINSYAGDPNADRLAGWLRNGT